MDILEKLKDLENKLIKYNKEIEEQINDLEMRIDMYEGYCDENLEQMYSDIAGDVSNIRYRLDILEKK